MCYFWAKIFICAILHAFSISVLRPRGCAKKLHKVQHKIIFNILGAYMVLGRQSDLLWTQQHPRFRQLTILSHTPAIKSRKVWFICSILYFVAKVLKLLLSMLMCLLFSLSGLFLQRATLILQHFILQHFKEQHSFNYNATLHSATLLIEALHTATLIILHTARLMWPKCNFTRGNIDHQLVASVASQRKNM